MCAKCPRYTENPARINLLCCSMPNVEPSLDHCGWSRYSQNLHPQKVNLVLGYFLEGGFHSQREVSITTMVLQNLTDRNFLPTTFNSAIFGCLHSVYFISFIKSSVIFQISYISLEIISLLQLYHGVLYNTLRCTKTKIYIPHLRLYSLHATSLLSQRQSSLNTCEIVSC